MRVGGSRSLTHIIPAVDDGTIAAVPGLDLFSILS